MGILHSIARIFGCKPQEDEQFAGPFHPPLLRPRQNPIADSSVRYPKIRKLFCTFYNGLKFLLQTLRSFPRPKRSADPPLPVQAPPSIPETTPSVTHHVVVSVPAHSSAGEEIISSPVLVYEDREEKVKIESILGSPLYERRIRHYSSRHRILLVGEGDFSFSASLAVAFASASNIIATSLDSQEFLRNNYSRALSNIEKLRIRSSIVLHEIDATKMANHSLLGHLKFDRIIYNFPYAGLQNVKNLTRESQLRCHRRLVRLFLKNAREMISEDGEIHITHKTNCFHQEFDLESVAFSQRLGLIEAVKFNYLDYPGYNTKCGFGGDRYFNCNPSKTYRFGLHKVRSRLEDSMFERFVYICWSIWTQRNKRLHGNEVSDPVIEIRILFNFIDDVRKSLPRRSALTRSSMWNPPQPGFVKVNFDAAFDPSSGNTTAAVVARISIGQILCWKSCILTYGGSVENAEAFAAWHAILLARNAGWKRIVIEGDCLSVIEALQSDTPSLSLVGVDKIWF